VNTAIEFDTTLQLTSLQPGLVYGMYLYGCIPALCATNHDEIDRFVGQIGLWSREVLALARGRRIHHNPPQVNNLPHKLLG